jgi:hypothetical protein
VDPTSRCKRTFIEIGMRDGDPAIQMAPNRLVYRSKVRLPNDVMGADAVDPNIEG